MNNKSARQRAQELGLGVFRICEELHGSNCGSSDALQEDIEDLYIEILQLYIDEWQDYPFLRTKGYDDAVKRLIEATLYETRYFKNQMP